MQTVAERIRIVSNDIAEIADKCARNPVEIELMAVTKTRSRAEVDEAYRAGLRLFGENRVAEAIEKYRESPADTRLHLVGHLQRNKAKLAASAFDQIESIDKIETVDAIKKHREEGAAPLEILVEINTSGESSKSGVTDLDALKALIEELLKREYVKLRGLMTIGPFIKDESRVRSAFAGLREALDVVRDVYGLIEARTLSMGMTSDYRSAIAEGSTRVRIGTAIFGERSE